MTTAHRQYVVALSAMWLLLAATTGTLLLATSGSRFLLVLVAWGGGVVSMALAVALRPRP